MRFGGMMQSREANVGLLVSAYSVVREVHERPAFRD